MKVLHIIFASMAFSFFAVSCQKVEESADEVCAYSFNFTINGEDSLTKSDATIGWTEGERVFIFFKPQDGTLLSTCLTMTYVGSGKWQESAGNIDFGSLGEGGKLSAVYVPYISDDTVPTFNDGTWTLDGGDVYYSCASNVDYIVSGSSVTAIIDMNIPDGYVQFGIDKKVAKDGSMLACNLFDSYDCVSLGSDLTFSEVATERIIMTGHEDGDYCWFYGKRNATATENCEWSLIRRDISFDKTVASSLVSQNNSYILRFTIDGSLPGLFSISPTKKVHFSKGNLVSFRQGEGDSATYTFGFENNQYDYRWRSEQIESMQFREFVGIDVGYCIDGVVDKVSRAPENTSGAFVYPNQYEYYYSGNIYESGFIEGDMNDHHTIDSPNHGVTIDDKDTWRSLTAEEWGYLLGISEQRYHPTTEFRDNCQLLRKNSRINFDGTDNFVRGIVVAPDDYDFTAHPLKDSYSLSEWVEAEIKYSLAFLPGESVPGLYWCAPECFIGDGVGVYALGIDPTESDFIPDDSLDFVPLRYRVAAFVRLFTPYPEDNWDN